MMSGLNDWLSVAHGADADDLRERILTGFKAGKPFTPYVPTIDLGPRPDRVLDFGCGVGRNFPYLRGLAGHVYGFDLPPMIARCRSLSPVAVDALWDDWAAVESHRFDLIFASLVLQHIEPAACRAYLESFARISPTVYLLTRTTTDFGTSVLDHCVESGLFECGACTIVEHDDRTHQLKVLGERPFDALRGSGDEAHCELLLHAR